MLLIRPSSCQISASSSTYIPACIGGLQGCADQQREGCRLLSEGHSEGHAMSSNGKDYFDGHSRAELLLSAWASASSICVASAMFASCAGNWYVYTMMRQHSTTPSFCQPYGKHLLPHVQLFPTDQPDAGTLHAAHTALLSGMTYAVACGTQFAASGAPQFFCLLLWRLSILHTYTPYIHSWVFRSAPPSHEQPSFRPSRLGCRGG